MKKLLSIWPIVLSFHVYLVYIVYYTAGSWFCQANGGTTVAAPWQNRNRSVVIRWQNGDQTVGFWCGFGVFQAENYGFSTVI